MDARQCDHATAVFYKLNRAFGTRLKCISDYHVHQLVSAPGASLSTLHLLCYRRRCKTRYIEVWLVAFCGGTYTLQDRCSFCPAHRSLHSPMTSLKTGIKTITYLNDIGCLEIQGTSLHKAQRYQICYSDERHRGIDAQILEARKTSSQASS